jgi:hypothetical protein
MKAFILGIVVLLIAAVVLLALQRKQSREFESKAASLELMVQDL